MDEKSRLCCLTLDETEFKPRTGYDTSNSVLGDVTIPNHDERANHALVFMLVVNVDIWIFGTKNLHCDNVHILFSAKLHGDVKICNHLVCF
jgi:hypothetical protein